jgi:transposase-like protein
VERIAKVEGKSARPGLYYCNQCKGQFTVTVGTVFERSKVPLSKWWMATYLMSSSKKGVSAHQIHRTLGVTYKTAWFMCHRIREAMREFFPEPMGGAGERVQVDETYVGRRTTRAGEDRRKKSGPVAKEPVVSLVDDGGRVRSFHVKHVSSFNIRPILRQQIDADSTLSTDEGTWYNVAGKDFARHVRVQHSVKEYVRGDATVNACENYFSILKRGLNGVYQHVSPKHLKRYVGEFDFRYNNRSKLGVEDAERTALAMRGISGKRLTYRRTTSGA